MTTLEIKPTFEWNEIWIASFKYMKTFDMKVFGKMQLI